MGHRRRTHDGEDGAAAEPLPSDGINEAVRVFARTLQQALFDQNLSEIYSCYEVCSLRFFK